MDNHFVPDTKTLAQVNILMLFFPLQVDVRYDQFQTQERCLNSGLTHLLSAFPGPPSFTSHGLSDEDLLGTLTVGLKFILAFVRSLQFNL